MYIFLFTDLEGSTQLWEENEESMSGALVRHDAIIQTHVRENEGRIIKSTGDGFLAVFEGGDPLSCAISIQRDLKNEPWDASLGELRVRIGLHAGHGEERRGDIFGPDVNRAARVMDAAWGGQILLTNEALLILDLPKGARAEDLGEHILKDLAEPQRLFGLLNDDLIQSFPPPRSLSGKPNNLPTHATPFIGRQDDLDALSAQLSHDNCRVITVLGPGGIGKTRLGIQTAAENIDRYGNGVYFIPLASLDSPNSIIPGIASAVNFPLYEGRDAKEQLLKYLSQKELLLVMDNFEHLVENAGIVNDIILASPHIQVLTTSRARLNISAECIYELDPMHYPDKSEQEIFENFDAVQLFIAYARRSDPDFVLEDQDRVAVVTICKLVSGMPLGIELAANWTRTLSPQEIAEELQNDIDFLSTELIDVPERQRSMRAVFDYSWRLLSEDEQAALARFSIFRGGFDKEAAKKVTGANLRTLSSLVDKSLVSKNAQGRFEIHELIRQFAEESLKKDASMCLQISQSHSRYYLSLAASLEEDIKGKDQLAALDTLDCDFDNLQLAWRQAVKDGDEASVQQALEGFYWFTAFRNHTTMTRSLFEKARQKWPLSGPNFDLAAALLLYYPDETPDPETYYRSALEAAQQAEDPENIAYALNLLGKHLAHHSEKIQEGIGILDESLAMYQEQNDLFGVGRVVDDLAFSYLYVDPQKRADLAEESAAIRQKSGDNIGLASAKRNMVIAQYLNGTFEKGIQQGREALEIAQEMHDLLNIAWMSVVLAEFSLFSGAIEDAFNHINLAYQLSGQLIDPDLDIQVQINKGMVEALANETYQELWDIANSLFAPKSEFEMHTPTILMGYALAAAGLENREMLNYFLSRGLGFLESLNASEQGFSWFAPMFAIHLQLSGQPEKAAQCLGAIDVAPSTGSSSWSDISMLSKLRTKLIDALGEEAFQAAFEKGKNTSLRSMVNLASLEELG